ncbi:choice-of-anchor K domain-containing protein [Aeromonas veronii]|uniref:choice-of-anchor K domain-containing protein n=1 Tax=Aeromonas veronii TaxID=654 RepID=UPI003D1A0EB4
MSTTDTAGNRASAADTESYRVDIVSPPAPKVTIVDDTNNDQLLRTSEIGDDQIQVKTEVNHDELVVGGKVTLTITNGDATKMVELMLVSGVLQQVNGEPAVGFTYNNGTVSWTETTPANGKSLTVTATQTDKAGNVSLPGSDNAQLLNEAPVTANKHANGLEDAASIAIPTLSGSDIDGTVVSFIIKSLPAHGTLYLGDVMVTADQAIAVADAGKLTFKPDANWNGDTGFTYVSVDNDGAVGVSPATVTIKVEAVNDLPTLTISNGAVVSEEGLSGGIKDTVGNSDSTDSVIASGKITVGDVDSQDTLNVTLSAPSTALTSGGAAVQWSWNAATKVLTGYTGTQGEADYKEVIDVKLTAPIGSTKGDWNYDVTLKAPLDHSDKGSEDAFSFQVGVSVSDGKTTVTDSFPITVEDDAPLAVVDDVKLNVVVDSLGFSGVDVSWSAVVGGMFVKHSDGPDNDSALDQLRWGRTRPGSPQSGYGFTDNDFGLNGELPLNEEIILGTFTHYNYAIFAGSEMYGATMNASFVVTDSMGRMTPVTIAIKFNHNETPNTGPDPRDIITIQSTTASFNFEGKVYSLEVLGFRELSGGNNLMKTIYTNEQESNSFALVVKLVEGASYQLPQTTGNVLSNDSFGADGSLSVIGYGVGSSPAIYTNGAGAQVVGLYGVLTILANGAYTYQVTNNGSQIPADAQEVFSYSVRDGDGDIMNSNLIISINPVDRNGVPVHLPLTVNGTDLEDSILMLNGENTANPDRINVSFGGNLLGEIISSSGSTDRVHTGTSYNKGSADQIVSSGAGNDHVETGGGNDIIYAGKTATDGAGTDDSQQLTVDQLKIHHIMIGSFSGSDAMLNSDALLLSVDVSSYQADVVNGGSGNDKIYGQSGSDILFGHTDNDYIDGGSHNDALRGGLGNDILIGCLGNDVLRGDEGADTFVWNKGDTISGSLTKDYIMDFNKGAGTANRLEGDQLDLRDLLDHDCSHNATDLRSLLSVFQDNEGVHLLVKESSIASVSQEIVLMSHSFDSLTGGSGTTANQVIDYMLSNNILDIDK